MKFFFPLAFVALLSLTYCSPAPEGASDEPVPTENQGTAVEQDQLDGDGTNKVSQMPDPNISPSEILADNEAAYADLHRTVTKNMAAINSALDKSTMNEKIKAALKLSYAEVAKYDNIYDIAKTSDQVSAETIIPYIKGLQSELMDLNLELK
jgi:hypothetical protein